MKRMVWVLIAVLLLTACGSQNGGDSAEAATQTSSSAEDAVAAGEHEEKSEPESGLSVDIGKEDVVITIPASFVGEDQTGELTEDDIENGVKSIVMNEDGSVTMTIDYSGYSKMMEEISQQMLDAINDMPENYGSITKVESNTGFTQATITVDREAFENSLDGFAVLGLYMQSAIYQIFNGSDYDQIGLTVDIVDMETGEIISTTTYPDAIGE